ncbi:hypothetical protein D3C76_1818420 [compost metagenome]
MTFSAADAAIGAMSAVADGAAPGVAGAALNVREAEVNKANRMEEKYALRIR